MSDIVLSKKIVRIISACLALQLLISYRVWLSLGRDFPTVPLFAALPVRWGNLPGLFFYGLMIFCCLFLLVRPLSKLPVTVFLVSALALVPEDASRLQPWLYLFALMLSALLAGEHAVFIFCARLVLSSAYLWSGLQKANAHFAVEMFPWLAEFTGQRAFAEGHHAVAYIAALAEAAAGIMLWVRPVRRVGCFLIFGTHLFILLSLGPTGHNWNRVVWPWNIAFAWMTYELFFLREGCLLPVFFPGKRSRVFISFIFLLCLPAPPLNFAGRWDHFLSGSYYSSVVSSGALVLAPGDEKALPASSKPFLFFSKKENKVILLLDAWALDVLEVPLYPEDRVHEALFRELRMRLPHPHEAELRLFIKSRFNPLTSVLRQCN